MNSKTWRAIGLGVPILTILLLLGIFKSIFGVDVNTNLFNTSVTPGIVLGLANVVVVIGVGKHYI